MHCAHPHPENAFFARGRGPWVFMTGPGRHRRGEGGPYGPGGGPFGPGGGRFPGRGPRRSRGDIRAAILALLTEAPMHGYQIIQELGERTDGAWRPSPGSVYPTLQALADEGLVRAVEEDGGRRLYELTDAGREPAAEAAATPAWEAVQNETAGDEGPHAMRKLAFGVGMAAMQVAQAGTAEQAEQAREILTETRKRLYRLLADESAGS
jgi:DNA-binding PadR family transcriptional regulator